MARIGRLLLLVDAALAASALLALAQDVRTVPDADERPRPSRRTGRAPRSSGAASVETSDPPREKEPRMAGIAAKFDKSHETLPVEELADAPVSSIAGVSDSDAEHLKAAFNIKTVRDLGTNKYFLWAQGVVALAD